MKFVGDNIIEVKDIAKDTKVNMEKGFNKAKSKKIWLTFWFTEIDLVKYQENFHYIGDFTERNIYFFTDSFFAQPKKKLAIFLDRCIQQKS